MQESSFLVVKDVATRYRVSPQTIRKMSRNGRMPKPLRMGNRDVWRKEDLEQWEIQ